MRVLRGQSGWEKMLGLCSEGMMFSIVRMSSPRRAGVRRAGATHASELKSIGDNSSAVPYA
jgi:hypothetical protein